MIVLTDTLDGWVSGIRYGSKIIVPGEEYIILDGTIKKIGREVLG